MQKALLVATTLTASLALSGCGEMTYQESANHALRIFCTAHQAEITHILLTPQQITAGDIVCRAMGYGLGNPPIGNYTGLRQ